MTIALLSTSTFPLHFLAEGSDQYYTNLFDAAEYVRDEMVDREETILLQYQSRSDSTDFVKQVVALAKEHTGIPDEGDYLSKNSGNYKASIRRGYVNGMNYFQVTYSMTYYTTKDEEEAVEEKIEGLFDTWKEEYNFNELSDYEKLRIIYEWIVHNVVYDYDHLGDESYERQYTAYAALFDGTCVCQGYSALLYNMALTAGIDCRIVTGDSDGPHAWNIIKLGNLYYDCDATWDSNLHNCEEQNFQYFLMGDEEFSLDHTIDQEFDTAEFHTQYPSSQTDYIHVEHPPCDVQEGVSFSFELANGSTVTNQDYDNVSTLIIYADKNSGNCLNLFKGLHRHIQELKGVGIKVLVAFRSNVTDAELKAFSFLYPYFVFSRRPANDTSMWEALREYGVSGTIYYPVVFLKDHHNKLIHFSKGHVSINSEYVDFLESLIEESALPNHDFNDVVTPATCTEGGYTTHTCSVCEYTFTDSEVPATGHSFTNYISDGNATTEADGTKTAKCDNCDVTDTIVDEGSKICSNHVFDSVVTPPTCTEGGYTTHTCQTCNDSYVDSEVPATGHSFTNYVSDGNATTEADGTKTAKCDNCEETDTVIDEGSKIDPSKVVYGDLSGDNRINMDDVIMLLRHVSKAHILTDSKALEACNIVEDGIINMDDVIRLLRYVSKAIPNLK